jgi:hypothetical protein
MIVALPLTSDTAGEQADMSEDNPGGCALNSGLEIFCQPAASVEPGEGPLDYPASGQQFKAFGEIGAFDDFERPGTKLGEPFSQLWFCIATIREEMAQPGIQ